MKVYSGYLSGVLRDLLILKLCYRFYIMVAGTTEHGIQADIVFVIEGTAINGAYLNDLKVNYVIPTLE